MNKSQNHMAVIQLKLLGYPLANIRKALQNLTGITQTDIGKKIGTTRQIVTLTLAGSRTQKNIQDKIANIYNVPATELFEDKNGNANTAESNI